MEKNYSLGESTLLDLYNLSFLGYHISATVNKYEDGNVLNSGFYHDVSIRVDRLIIYKKNCFNLYKL